MKRNVTLILFLSSYLALFSQDDPIEQKLQGLINYSFVNGAKLENFIPEITYGFTEKAKIKKAENTFWVFKANPYVGAQLSARDSSSFLPVLMSPGATGFQFVHGLYLDGEKWKFSFCPLSFGIKAFSNFKDTAITLLQHGIHSSIGIQYKKRIALSVQIGANWHNLTSNSEDKFNQIFGTRVTDVYHLNILLQSQINPDAEKPLYLVCSFNTFLNQKSFNNLPNRRILSVGIKKDIYLASGAPPIAPQLIN
jgi:hypothetical protein